MIEDTDISLFRDIPDCYGVEAYMQILPPSIKVCRIFKLRDNPTELPKKGMPIKKFTNVAVLPIVTNSFDVCNTVKLLFGTTTYKTYFKNYIYPKKYTYKSHIIPGSKLNRVLNNSQAWKKFVSDSGHLPNLTGIPSSRVNGQNNAILDFSQIFNLTLPNEELLSRPKGYENSMQLIPQILSFMLTKHSSSEIEDSDRYSLFQECDITGALPLKETPYKNLIIPIKFTATDQRIAAQWFNDDRLNLSLEYKKNPKVVNNLGIIKFILSWLDNDTFLDNPLYAELSTALNQLDHAIFVFYTDTHAFYIDKQELMQRDLKFEAIKRMIRSSLKVLISLNSGALSPSEVKEDEDDNISDASVIEKRIDSQISLDKNFDDAITNSLYNSDLKGVEINKIAVKQANQSSKLANVPEINVSKSKSANMDATKLVSNLDPDKDKKLLLNAAVSMNNRTNAAKPVAKADADEDTEYANEIEQQENELDGGFSADDDAFSDDNVAENENEPEIDEDNPGEELKDSLAEDTDGDEDHEKEVEETIDFINEVTKDAENETKNKIANDASRILEQPLTKEQQKVYNKVKDRYKSIKYDEHRSLEELLTESEAISIDLQDAKKDILDKSYNYCTLKDFTDSYCNKTMAKDTVAIVKSFADSNKSMQMHIVGFKKEDISDQFNSVERYTFTLKDLNGTTHTVKFKMPIVDKDGFMLINGNKKLLKKQLVLKPVTKTSPDDVYLMSNYNKTHIQRIGSVMNRNLSLLNKLLKDAVDHAGDPAYKRFKVLFGSNVAVNQEKKFFTTIEYDAIASVYSKIILKVEAGHTITFYLNQPELRKIIAKEGLKYKDDPSILPVGIDGDTVIIIDAFGKKDSFIKTVLSAIKASKCCPVYDEFDSKLKMPRRKMYTMIELQSKKVPLIVFLSSLFTFTEVVRKLDIDLHFVRKVKASARTEEEAAVLANKINYNSIDFKDGTLYYDMYPLDKALIINGLGELNTQDMNYISTDSMDNELNSIGTYIDYTFNKHKSRNLIKGWISFKELFIDPITYDILNELKLPTDFLELFLYANSLLQDNAYSNHSDMANWRVRDYEMLNDYLYETLANSYRTYSTKGKQRVKFTIPEDDIINKMNKSFVIVNYDTTNPINEFREKETITYKGPHGINTERAFKNIARRANNRNSIGTIALQALENGNVGIVRYLTYNPRIVNTRGFIEPLPDDQPIDFGSSTILSVEESMLPYILHDDPKRIGYAANQTKHTIAGDYFDPPITGTGAEQTMSSMVSSTFCNKATQDGKVVLVDNENKYVVIKYKDGSSERMDFGSRYFRNSDFFLENALECNVKEGQTVHKGDVVVYNKDYFKKHLNSFVLTQGIIARVAVHEGECTEEDSTAVSYRLCNRLICAVIKRKQLVLGANANIVKIAKIGDHIRFGDPLMIYEDSKNDDADMNVLDLLGVADDAILNEVARHSADANYTGVIKDIKIYWNMEPDRYGASVKKLINSYISHIRKQITAEEKITGNTSELRKKIMITKPSGPMSDRIAGCIIPDQGGVVVEFYIEHKVPKRAGDKITVNTSLKSIINRVMPKELCARRVNNNSRFNVIDVETSSMGAMKRMVTSIYETGSLNKLIFERGKGIAEEYFKEQGLNNRIKPLDLDNLTSEPNNKIK